MQNQVFKFNLYGQGRDAIYKADTIKNVGMSSGTTYFLVNNENLTKSKIESIDIVSFNNVPEGAIYVDDLSSNSDGSVEIYYLENTDTELNKVYIATSNGLLKMNTKICLQCSDYVAVL